jgi:BirA family transcriptional regulator, biotin operon repressor / biotin---[acetyl-CoA-carboxylase] ligase
MLSKKFSRNNMSAKQRLISLLADGQFHSGQELGLALGMTRAGVWKIIQQLCKLGIDVQSIKGKGYQIPNGIELLDLSLIERNLSPEIRANCNLQLFSELDSTNQYLINQQQTLPSGNIVLAEHQTQGRGRRQKSWLSPFGANLYCSFLYHIDKDPSELSGLSLAIGVSVANMLEKYGIANVQLKWPNDVLWQHKKIAGILIELSAQTNSSTKVIVGIGLNVTMPNNVELDQPWMDIHRIIGRKPQRNVLAASLITEVMTLLQSFQRDGFENFRKQWQARDAFYNQPVTLQTPSQSFQGIAKGINHHGELRIMINNKTLHFMNGEVSLRGT